MAALLDDAAARPRDDRDLAREVGAGQHRALHAARASSATKDAARPRPIAPTSTLAGFGPFDWNGTLDFVRVKQPKADASGASVGSPAISIPGSQPVSASTFNDAVADARADRRGRRIAPRRVAGDRADRARARSHHQDACRTIKKLHEVARRHRSRDDRRRAARARRAAELLRRRSRPSPTTPATTTVLRPQLAPIPGVFFHASKAVLAPRRACSARNSSARSARSPPSVCSSSARRTASATWSGSVGCKPAFETRLAGQPDAARS